MQLFVHLWEMTLGYLTLTRTSHNHITRTAQHRLTGIHYFYTVYAIPYFSLLLLGNRLPFLDES
jgi:hypothetical protein